MTVAQLTLDARLHLKPQAAAILHLLETRDEVSAFGLKTGRYGIWVDAVSQRVSELNAAGYPVVKCGREYNLAVYRMEEASTSSRRTSSGARSP